MKIITSGESHGQNFYGIVEGFQSHFKPDLERINKRLKTRQAVYGRGDRMKIEDDKVNITTGLWNGETTGAPLTFVIANKSTTPPNEKTTVPRPGHADLGGILKFDLDDVRTVTERASARRTVMDVAIGEFSREVLEDLGISVYGFTKAIGPVEINSMAHEELEVNDHPLLCPDSNAESKMMEEIKKGYDQGYTLGGKVTLVVNGLPAGIGTFTERGKRLTSIIASGLFDIPSIRGVLFGDAEEIWKMKGYDTVDQIHSGFVRETNHAGGIEGGMTNGEQMIVNLIAKPISTQKRGVKSIDVFSGIEVETNYVRSDTCVVAAIVVVATAMLSTIILSELNEEFGGFTFQEFKDRLDLYRRRVKIGR
jgi:chorismate synthase